MVCAHNGVSPVAESSEVLGHGTMRVNLGSVTLSEQSQHRKPHGVCFHSQGGKSGTGRPTEAQGQARVTEG